MVEELKQIKRLKAAVKRQQSVLSKIHEGVYEELLEYSLGQVIDELELRIEELEEACLIALEDFDS